MLTWVTVWVLTVTVVNDSYNRSHNLNSHYQLQYSSQDICEKQRRNHKWGEVNTRCDFQQIPLYRNVK